MNRAFTVEADDGRLKVWARVNIVSEPGRLTRDEVEHLKVETADAFMRAMPGLPFLNVGISEVKVRR